MEGRTEGWTTTRKLSNLPVLLACIVDWGCDWVADISSSLLVVEFVVVGEGAAVVPFGSVGRVVM